MHHNEPTGGDVFKSVLYVDGIAVSANLDNIPIADPGGSGEVANYVGKMVVGAAEIPNDGTNATYGLYFDGVVDDLEGYVFGDNETGTPGVLSDGEDWGTFDLFADNAWIQQTIDDDPILQGTLQPGDVNKDGDVDSDDITAFIDGWLSEKTLQGAHGTVSVGDWNTWDDGDMNHDGITDLDDALILHEALIANGAGGLTQFGFAAVPEPSTVVTLICALVGATIVRRRV